MASKINVGILLWLLLSVFCSVSEAIEFDYSIAAAEPQGLYFKIGLGFAEIAENLENPIYIRVDSSYGSVDNLIRIMDSSADFALVQSDVAQSRCLSQNGYPPLDSGYSILAALYIEAIHICVRRELQVSSLNELRGKRISVGKKGSGTMKNAVAALGASGITLNEIIPRHLSFSESADSLDAGVIDAAFFTAGVSHPVIEKLMKNGKIYLLSIDAYTIKRMKESCPYSILTSIPEDSYTGMEKDVSSIGITACLVCSDRVPGDIVARLLDGLFTQQQRFSNYHEELVSLDMLGGIKGIRRDAMHPIAEKLYDESNTYIYAMLYNLVDILIPCLLPVGLLILIIVYRVKLTKCVYRFESIRIFIPLIIGVPLVLIPATVILYYQEHNINEYFSNIFESGWSIVVYLVSGFENRAPLTNGGKVIAVVGIMGGIILGSILTSAITVIKSRRLLMGNPRLGRAYTDHIVILGWNEKGGDTVKEILKWDRKIFVAILSENEEAEVKKHIGEDNARVTIIRGTPYVKANLSRMKLQNADSVLVLSSSVEDHSPDDSTIRILLMVTNQLESKTSMRKNPHVVAEVINPDMKLAVKQAGADEIVCLSDIGGNLLVNCIVNPGVSQFFEDILGNSDDTNEVYLKDVPDEWHGKSFKEFRKWVAGHQKDSDPMIPIGIKRGDSATAHEITGDGQKIDAENNEDGIFTNPKKPTNYMLEKGDKILILAYRQKALDIIDKIKELS